MAVKACPQCGSHFIPTVSRCADCGVTLEFVADAEGEALAPGEATPEAAEIEDPVAYALDDWPAELRVELSTTLTADGIPFQWEADELVVEERDADAVEQLIDDLDHPDALDADDDDGDDRGAALLSTLYVAADVLVGDPDSSAAIADLLEATEALEGVAPPYGIEPATWQRVGELTEALADVLTETEPEPDEDDVRAAARQLRDQLRPMV